MSRNGLNLLNIYKDFTNKLNNAHFEQKIQEEVNICGSLLRDFTNILIEFFKSQSPLQTPEVKKKVELEMKVPEDSRPPNQPGKVSQMLEKLRQFEDSITKKDSKKFKSPRGELSGEVMEYARKVGSAETEKVRLEGAKSLQEDLEKKLEKARRENQVLRERNENLMEEVVSVTASKEMIINMMKILCGAVNNFFQDKFHSVVTVLSNEDREGNMQCKALIEGLKKLHLLYSHREEKRSVNLVLSDGEAVRFTTNKLNNIGIAELERFLSKKVKSVAAPQLLGGGYREMKIMNGYVNCPTLGWGEGQYKVVTEAVPVHLGQGYSSRPGQRLGGVWGPRSRK